MIDELDNEENGFTQSEFKLTLLKKSIDNNQASNQYSKFSTISPSK